MSYKHFTLQERELADLIKKLDSAVIRIGAVMMQRIWGPIKTGRYACAHAVQLLLASFRDYYGFSWARNRDDFVLFCFVLPQKVQYDFTM